MQQNVLALCIPFSPLSIEFVEHVSLYHTWGRFVNPLNLKILDFLQIGGSASVDANGVVSTQAFAEVVCSQTHCASVADKSQTRRPDAYVNADCNPSLEFIGP